MPSPKTRLPGIDPPVVTSSTTDERPLIVLTLEGLTASSLGCYGSSWSTTPAIDRIASQGCVWDRCIASADDPREVLGQWLRGADEGSCFHHLRERGSLECFTDDPQFSTSDAVASFDQVCLVEPDPDSPAAAAVTLEQTHLAQLIAAAIDRVVERSPIGLLWIHSRFLTRCWDAPRDFVDPADLDDDALHREEAQWIDETVDPEFTSDDGIPHVFADVAPPQVVLTEATHPDLLISWMRTYACQIRLFDDLIDLMMHSISDHDPHVVVAGTSGFGFGDNGRIGHRYGPLRSCDIRLPVIIRKSSSSPIEPAVRVPHVVSSCSIPDVLARLTQFSKPLVEPAHWCPDGNEFTGNEFTPHVATASARCVTAINTPRWFFIQDHPTTSDTGRRTDNGNEHLFLKPDDTHDVNDVASLRRDVVDRLKLLANPGHASDHGDSGPLPSDRD